LALSYVQKILLKSREFGIELTHVPVIRLKSAISSYSEIDYQTIKIFVSLQLYRKAENETNEINIKKYAMIFAATILHQLGTIQYMEGTETPLTQSKLKKG